MKKIIVGIFCVILLNLLIILAFNINIKYIMNDIIEESGIHNEINKSIAGYFNKSNIIIVKKNEVSDIINDFLDIMINDHNEETSDILVMIINRKREAIKQYGINDDEIDKIIYEIEAGIDGNNNFEDILSNKQKIGLEAYIFLSATELRNFLIIGITLCCIIILIINRINSLVDIGISFLGASFLIKGSCIIIARVMESNSLSSMIGNIKINLNYMNSFIYTYGFLAIILILGYIVYYLNNKSKKA